MTHRRACSAACSIALPNTKERSDRLEYLEQYSCKPPPLLLPLLSFSQVFWHHCDLLNLNALQIGVFVYHVIILAGQDRQVGPDGPAYIEVFTSNLICLSLDSKRDPWYSTLTRRKRFGDSSPTCLFTVDTFTSPSMSLFRLVSFADIQVSTPRGV